MIERKSLFLFHVEVLILSITYQTLFYRIEIVSLAIPGSVQINSFEVVFRLFMSIIVGFSLAKVILTSIKVINNVSVKIHLIFWIVLYGSAVIISAMNWLQITVPTNFVTFAIYNYTNIIFIPNQMHVLVIVYISLLLQKKWLSVHC